MGADADARPWEMVGGVGFDKKKKVREPLYIPPTTRPDLQPNSEGALVLTHRHAHRTLHTSKRMTCGPALRCDSPSRGVCVCVCARRRQDVAEEFNTRAVKAFKDKSWQLCYDLASEAIRLNPRKKEYLGNRAAAALKLKGKRYLRQAAEDSVNAYEMDKFYIKAYQRAAEAHLALNERATARALIPPSFACSPASSSC